MFPFDRHSNRDLPCEGGMIQWSGEAWYLDGGDVSSTARIQVIEPPLKPATKTKGKKAKPVPFGFALPSKKSKKRKAK